MIEDESTVDTIISQLVRSNSNDKYNRVVFIKIKYTTPDNLSKEFTIPIAYNSQNSSDIIRNFFNNSSGQFIGSGYDSYEITTDTIETDDDAFDIFNNKLNENDPDNNFKAYSIPQLQTMLAQHGYNLDICNHTLTAINIKPQIDIPFSTTDSLSDFRAYGTEYAILCQSLHRDSETNYGRYFFGGVNNSSNSPLICCIYSTPNKYYPNNTISPTNLNTGLRLHMKLNIAQFDNMFPDALGDLSSFNQRNIIVTYGYLPQSVCTNPLDVLRLNYLRNNDEYASDFNIPVKQASDSLTTYLPLYQVDSRYFVSDNVNLDNCNSIFFNGQNYNGCRSKFQNLYTT